MKKISIVFITCICILNTAFCKTNTLIFPGATVVLPEKKPARIMADIMKTLDTNILKSSDSVLIGRHISGKKPDIVNYMNEKYKLDVSDGDAKQLIILGMLVSYHEKINQDDRKAEEIVSCLLGIVSTALGIDGIISAIRSGSWSMATVWSSLKTIIRSYFAWFMIAWGIYEAGKCFGWWGVPE